MGIADDDGLPVRLGEVVAGKYVLTRVIAYGGMGVVAEAHHLDLDQPVAIKFVRHDLTDDADIIDRFMEEARVCAALKSPHVASVLDFGRMGGGQPYLVMEYLRGMDLAELLHKRGPLPLAEAVGYVLEACRGLSDAHALGIVHRDIKLENLFLARSSAGRPTLKILDFGICKRLRHSHRNRVTDPRRAVGSPATMAPEQLRDASNVDARTDVWALGAVLFELLTGRPAFDGDSIVDICSRVLSGPTPRLSQFRPDLPPYAEHVVLSCMERDVDKRVQSVEELAQLLGPLQQLRISTVPPPPSPREMSTESGSYDPGKSPTGDSAPPAAVDRDRSTRIPGLPEPRWGRRIGVFAAIAASAAVLTWAHSPRRVEAWVFVESKLWAHPVAAGQGRVRALERALRLRTALGQPAKVEAPAPEPTVTAAAPVAVAVAARAPARRPRARSPEAVAVEKTSASEPIVGDAPAEPDGGGPLVNP